jgi:hypothetical protein
LSFATVSGVVGVSTMVMPQQSVSLVPFKGGVVLSGFCIILATLLLLHSA